MLLEDKVVFITGGGSGIGRACAIVYAAEGAKVVVVDVDEHAAEGTAHAGDGSIALMCDVADGASVDRAVKTAFSHFGRIDAVHNNAGIASALRIRCGLMRAHEHAVGPTHHLT